MDDTTLRRLLLSKRLHINGTTHSKSNTEIDRFIAIHNFDNSIELFLKIIATNQGITAPARQDIKFKDLWNQLNTELERKTPSYRLPLKDQMFNLHETRNLAQHQGDAPSFETVIKYQEYSKDFLVECFKDIFDTEYDKVCASSLVKDTKVRAALEEAEKEMESNNFKNSIRSSRKAFAHIRQKEIEDFSSDMKRFTTFGVLNRHERIKYSDVHSFEIHEREIARKINDSVGNAIDNINRTFENRAEKINNFARAIEEELAILKFGVDYKSFKLFDKVSPHAFFTIGSSEPMIIDTKEEYYTKENALFCYEFVLELALKLQSLDN